MQTADQKCQRHMGLGGVLVSGDRLQSPPVSEDFGQNADFQANLLSRQKGLKVFKARLVGCMYFL